MNRVKIKRACNTKAIVLDMSESLSGYCERGGLENRNKQYHKDAKVLYDILTTTIPCGTYDVLMEMLASKENNNV